MPCAGPYPPAAPLVEFIMGHFYDRERWRPDRREEVLIGLLTAHCNGQGLPLAVQLVGARWRDEELLAVARAVDGVVDGLRCPPDHSSAA